MLPTLPRRALAAVRSVDRAPCRALARGGDWALRHQAGPAYLLKPGAPQGPGTVAVATTPCPLFADGVTVTTPTLAGGPGGILAPVTVQLWSAVAGCGSACAAGPTSSKVVNAATSTTIRLIAPP